MKYSLGMSSFLDEILSLSQSLFSSISLHCSLKKSFLSLLAIFWNSAFSWVLLQSCLIFVTPWTVACQVLLPMGSWRQEYWSGLPCLPSEDLPNLGIELPFLMSPALAGGFFTTNATFFAFLLCLLPLFPAICKASSDLFMFLGMVNVLKILFKWLKLRGMKWTLLFAYSIPSFILF